MAQSNQEFVLTEEQYEYILAVCAEAEELALTKEVDKLYE